MKRIYGLLALVTLIALVTATPALASGGRGLGGGGGWHSFTLVGYISAIGDNTITISALNDGFAGQELIVQVTDSTRFFERIPDGGRQPIDFDDLAVGDSANIKGTVIDGEFVASQVTVDVPLYCFQ